MSTHISSTPLVSFTVTAYNTEKYIAECLDSIFTQQGNYNFEVVVVDDASTDGTEQVVRSYTDSRLRYIRHTKNKGAFATVNRGFEEARGQFVTRIDSDDRYRSDFLLTVVPILQKYPQVGLVYGDIAMIDPQGKITAPGGNVERQNLPTLGNELIPLLEKNYLPAPTTIARKEAWAEGLPVPPRFDFCDWYLSTSIAKKWDFYYCDQVLADYRVHPQNSHRSMILDKTGESIIFKVLEQVFKEPERQDEKKKAKARIYGSNYLTLSNQYFGCKMLDDARRCYLKAIQYQPHLGLQPDILIHLLGTFVGMSKYEKIKIIAKQFLAGKKHQL
ncbi:glycosyltransferase family 2 protein [Nodularia sphaerocarpa]|uniref:glycosyltransferase family 2 protein n=1 Tax=Nodularia sphaerocarpa TaxID=137816 RepID=UPI001EFB7566|nr:glycosyltransferase [Nodularia sphaerocarpa]MDB9375007.1 glycosyltransferase [Nodularia sphaerocarpa CS-585]MDB9377686.1 glycosyltransferase [Nodularia sphaerocarpa CS-585A2]ULP74199.1 Putative glycosyltransferase EpsH [Nodularia sphaerocarpa UHCC 0038]